MKLTIKLPKLDNLRSAPLVLGALALFTAGAWDAHRIAGMAVAGLSLLIVEALTRPERGGQR